MRKNNMYKFLFFVSFLTGCSQWSAPQSQDNKKNQIKAEATEKTQAEATFESIKTHILEPKCISCHSENSQSEGGREYPFTTEEKMISMESDDFGPFVIPGQPFDSILLKSMSAHDSVRGKIKKMPPDGASQSTVTADEQLVVAQWIQNLKKKSASEKEPSNSNSSTNPGSSTVPASNSGSSSAGCVLPTSPSVSSAPIITEPDVIDFRFISVAIFEPKCNGCHKTGGKAEDLIFSTRAETIKLLNEQSQALVVPGKPNESLMYLTLFQDRNVRGDARLMPPRKEISEGRIKPMTPQEIQWMNKWIAGGAL